MMQYAREHKHDLLNLPHVITTEHRNMQDAVSHLTISSSSRDMQQPAAHKIEGSFVSQRLAASQELLRKCQLLSEPDPVQQHGRTKQEFE